MRAGGEKAKRRTALELLLSVAALAGLLIVRFYYLPGRPK
jgi:hypothetical protein